MALKYDPTDPDSDHLGYLFVPDANPPETSPMEWQPLDAPLGLYEPPRDPLQKAQDLLAMVEATGPSGDITRGAVSGRGRPEDPRSSKELRRDLFAMSGASEEDVEWHDFARGRR
jgi:hypothetical protein